MKRAIIITLAALLVAGCTGLGRGPGRRISEGEIAGAWEHVSPDAPQYRQIKILSATHFVWAIYERGSGMLVATGGGTYEYDGKVYIERLEFGSESLALGLIGEDQVFAVKLDGDQWHHQGTLSNGVQVREVWKRIE